MLLLCAVFCVFNVVASPITKQLPLSLFNGGATVIAIAVVTAVVLLLLRHSVIRNIGLRWLTFQAKFTSPHIPGQVYSPTSKYQHTHTSTQLPALFVRRHANLGSRYKHPLPRPLNVM